MSNPILNSNRFRSQDAVLTEEPMTINGTLNKIFMLFACLIAGVAMSVYWLFTNSQTAPMVVGVSSIVGFLLVLITCFNVRIAKYTAAPYALCEGLALGSISALFEAAYSGIVFQAISLTFVVLFVMLLLYKARVITYTERLRSIILTGLLSVMCIYLIQIVASFFGRGIPAIFESGPIGIGFSIFVIILAAFSLIQDFYFIEESSNQMLPKDFEWYGAMGLMITLVWLYLEILRLLAKVNSRR